MHFGLERLGRIQSLLMVTIAVRWRPSGGRGEWEIVPLGALVNKEVVLLLPELGIKVPTEVVGRNMSGKPRLRKHSPNDRDKLHLVPLVMALARLPDPAREDRGGPPQWPLKNKKFLIHEMIFEVERVDARSAYLRPLQTTILDPRNSTIDLRARFRHVAADFAIAEEASPEIANAIHAHWRAAQDQVNSATLRRTADDIQSLLDSAYGEANAASLSTIVSIEAAEVTATGANEGRLLSRVHHYRERNPALAKRAKKAFRRSHDGRLYCECCGFEPALLYGPRGADRIHAHHIVPVSELLDDSVTSIDDFAMVCPNCHDLIHAERPWLTVEQVRDAILETRTK